MLARAGEGDSGTADGFAPGGATGAMAAVDAVLLAPFERGMLGDNCPEVEDADQVGELLNLDDPAGAVGNAVVVAADGDEAVVANPALELQDGIEAMLGERLQLGLLGGERLRHDALGGPMDPDVRDLAEPVGELGVEVLEATEAAAEEEVLADIAELYSS